MRTNNFKNHVLILAIVEYQNWPDVSPSLKLNTCKAKTHCSNGCKLATTNDGCKLATTNQFR